MNKFLIICLAAIVCVAAGTAVYSRARYHGGGHKLHLGGAAYGYHQPKYTAHGLSYRKPVALHTPIVYAHKSYSKPKVTHYIKPSHGHELHHAPVYRSKPVYYLGGHAGHGGVVYKPAVHSVHHAPAYVHKSHY